MKRALSLISRIHEAGNSFIISKLKEIGQGELSPSHGDILAALYTKDKVTMKEISKRINRTKATVSVLVDKLEKSELARREKSNEDSRNTFIVLTEKGKALEKDFKRISQELNRKLYNNLSEGEAKILDELLEKMAKN